ncbi:hypothetical protein SARC_00034 [Sphaeroforma arctica JP610]|uniref:Uncharacterized protein n=1 Tax=Sphaeroforma arctica JP610 TaxID=667725 RepID=A0A0L0GFV9_9EUKA|nr:hypothetical protein SARC_00034 [Sphaeroforma arctica JP610]KNC87902.1 hypothetical protein SARC_00034 [Sphaeroforma arctica JP610]|eukprot:XP_014161804.1 hypothetical protein SARC_00034 [Sphaeroforma arctica JP610]
MEGLGDYSDSDVECLQTLHAILSHKDSANWPPAVVLMLTTNVDKAAGCHGNRDEKTRQPSPQRRTRFGLTSRIEALLKVSHMEKTIQRCTDMCFLLWQRQLVRIYIKRTVTSTPQAKTDKRMTAKGDEQVGLNEGQRGVAVLSVLLGAVADGMGVCAHAQHIAPGLLIEQQHAHVVKVLDECLLQPLPKHVEGLGFEGLGFQGFFLERQFICVVEELGECLIRPLAKHVEQRVA